MTGISAKFVVAIGELVVDWISTSRGGGFIESSTYVKSLGGNASNVAIALARLGVKSRILAKVGDDIHGKYLTHVLSEERVDTRYVRVDKSAPTAQCYVFTTLDDDNTFLNWPPGNAAQQLTTDDITDESLDDACCIHTTGISLTRDPRRQAVLGALDRAKQKGLLVSFDAGFPTGEGKGSIDALRSAISMADIVKVNLLELFFWAKHMGAKVKESDLDFISAYENPPSSGHESKNSHDAPDLSQERILDLARHLFISFAPKILLVTMAGHGSLVLKNNLETWGQAYEVNCISGVGAGDAYVAGFLRALYHQAGDKTNLCSFVDSLDADRLRLLNDFAGAVGALCTTNVSAYEGLPQVSDVQELMRSRSDRPA